VRSLRPTVRDSDLDQNVLDIDLRIFHEDIKVSVIVENSGVEQFEFRLILSTSPVFVDQSCIWEFSLRVLVQVPHVRVRRRAVEIEVVLLDVFSVIAFVPRQSEDALLENRVMLVPESDGEAEKLTAIRNPSDAIFIPS